MGGWEILLIFALIGVLVIIYFLGYRHGKRSERIKNLESKVK
jgi:ABC-type cobalt transport system substrate-binding protein